LQVATYYLLDKFDIFHYASGQMVATRDTHTFTDPAAALAAGRVETKALESALKEGQSRIDEMSRKPVSKPTAQSAALGRVSNAMNLARTSLKEGSAGLNRKSLISVDESAASRMMQVGNMEQQLHTAAGELDPVVRSSVEPDLQRVSAAVNRLKRVSVAVDRQHAAGAKHGGTSPRGMSPRGV
jgi:hypothetical protein